MINQVNEQLKMKQTHLVYAACYHHTGKSFAFHLSQWGISHFALWSVWICFHETRARKVLSLVKQRKKSFQSIFIPFCLFSTGSNTFKRSMKGNCGISYYQLFAEGNNKRSVFQRGCSAYLIQYKECRRNSEGSSETQHRLCVLPRT